MKKRKLGNSDLLIHPLTFGAWAIGGWMWGGADEKEALEALDSSIDLGMTTIDTAPVYGFGHSEKLVGKAIKGKRDKVEILSKFGLVWSGTKGSFFFSSADNSGNPLDIYRYAAGDSIIKECEESLRRLKTDYIDLLQIHWPDPTTAIEETMEAMNKLLEQGKVRAIGVCNYDDIELTEGLKFANLASNQVPYSMLRRDIESKLVPLCLKENVGILAYSPLQRGLLTGKFSPDHKFNEGDNRPTTPYFKPENIEKVNSFLLEIKPIAESKSASLAQLVLRWTIEQPGVASALAGARNSKQVSDNFGATQIELTAEEIHFINDKLNQLKLEI